MSILTGLIKRSTTMVRPLAQAYAEGNMIATVRVTRPSTPVFNRATGGLAAMGAETLIHEGPGRVYGVQGPVQYAIGEEQQFFSSTFVSIPIGATKPRVDDVVEVLAHPDPNIVGRSFRVQDVEAGGQIPVVHRMQVVGIQASREWVQQ